MKCAMRRRPIKGRMRRMICPILYMQGRCSNKVKLLLSSKACSKRIKKRWHGGMVHVLLGAARHQQQRTNREAGRVNKTMTS
jgi:hypothetical protein